MAKNGYTRYPRGQSRVVCYHQMQTRNLLGQRPPRPAAGCSSHGFTRFWLSILRMYPIFSPPPEYGQATRPTLDQQPTRNARTKPRFVASLGMRPGVDARYSVGRRNFHPGFAVNGASPLSGAIMCAKHPTYMRPNKNGIML